MPFMFSVRGMLRILLCLAVFALPASRAVGADAVTQPAQPASGPGGRDYPHQDMRVSTGGSGYNAWYVFEPADPPPASAPVAIMAHGYTEFKGYAMHRAFIRHTVRKGTVVIYPRYQTGMFTPCSGPLNSEKCLDAALAGIRGALQFLKANPDHVQPELDKASYFGFSFGGILVANLANRWTALGLPQPRAIFLDDPHDGGLLGPGEPALDASLAGIPSSTLFQCHSGAKGTISEPGQQISSCNAVFPRVAHIPTSHKDLVLTHDDAHGEPVLSSEHGVCATGGILPNMVVNAYDWNFCWKVFDALRSCAYAGKDCEYALGDTPEHRSHGHWSDGTPVVPLKTQKQAPIEP
jgi:hypothetical protein